MIALKKKGHNIPCISTINKTMISFQQTNITSEKKGIKKQTKINRDD